MKKFVFPFLVIAVVLIAGCTDGGDRVGVVSGLGFEIIDFSIEPSEARSGSSVSFTFTAENQGNFLVDKTKHLFTLILPTDWIWDKEADKTIASTTKDLKPADPSVERAADVFSKKFRPKAPTLSKGQTRTDQATVRAYYDYQTDANGIVYLYPYGEEIEDTTSFASDNAPIRVDVKTSPVAPVLESAEESFSLIIDITNVGSGKVFLPGKIKTGSVPSIGIDEYNKVNISIEIRGVGDEHDGTKIKAYGYLLEDSECQGASGMPLNESTIDLYGKTNPTATIMCDIKAENKPTTKTPVSIVVTASYGYYTERSDSVTILGRQ